LRAAKDTADTAANGRIAATAKRATNERMENRTA
jgi:hypothetical protein